MYFSHFKQSILIDSKVIGGGNEEFSLYLSSLSHELLLQYFYSSAKTSSVFKHVFIYLLAVEGMWFYDVGGVLNALWQILAWLSFSWTLPVVCSLL